MRMKKEETIPRLFGCHRKTVKRIVVAYLDEENVGTRPRGGSRPLLSSQHEDSIRAYISDDCSITLESIQEKLIEKFEVHVSVSTIFRAIRGFSFSLKRTTRIPAHRDEEDLVERRRLYAIEFFSFLSQKDGENIFFLDEVGFCVTMRSTRGRAPKGKRAIQLVPTLRSRNISVCCAMSKKGAFFFKRQPRVFNTISFCEYLDELLDKFEEQGLENCILIMDNVHHSQEVLISRRGHAYCFMPPYSPFLNPIENMFSQWKQKTKSCRPNNEEELMKMIDSSFAEINPEDCAGYYRRLLEMLSRCLRKEEIRDYSKFY
jgi:transposase